MQLRVHEYEGGVDIELVGVTGRQHQVLSALTACQRGQCSCLPDQHPKLESMKVRSRTDAMRIQLKTKVGEEFDASVIYLSLRRALHEISREVAGRSLDSAGPMEIPA